MAALGGVSVLLSGWTGMPVRAGEAFATGELVHQEVCPGRDHLVHTHQHVPLIVLFHGEGAFNFQRGQLEGEGWNGRVQPDFDQMPGQRGLAETAAEGVLHEPQVADLGVAVHRHHVTDNPNCLPGEGGHFLGDHAFCIGKRFEVFKIKQYEFRFCRISVLMVGMIAGSGIV
ncbi:MAG: hypothetical protein GEEBNDBF_01044 [bacterium]|nr:hypothetical protein [bacterium]